MEVDNQKLSVILNSRQSSMPTREFIRFHLANRHVYPELVSMCYRLLGAGRNKYGIGGLFEVLRWRYAFETDHEEFKLNNNYRAYYARLIAYHEPLLRNFFCSRSSQGSELIRLLTEPVQEQLTWSGCGVERDYPFPAPEEE